MIADTTKAVRAGQSGGPALRRRTRQAALIACLLAPSLLIFLCYRILPLLWNLVISLQEWSPYRPPQWIGFDNYQELLFDDPIFWQAFVNTLWFMASSLVAIAIALGLALLVDTDIRGREIYRTIIFLSYPLLTVAVAIIWRWMYDERVGLFNYVLRGLGIIDQPIPFLQSFAWSLPCAILANIWQILGFYMIITLTGLQSIPQNLYEAAAIDGAAARHRFWRITLPMLRPSLFLCIAVGLLNSISSFDLVYVLTNGGPGHATELLITYIYKLGFVETKFDMAASVTVVLFVLLIAIAWFANRLSGGNAGAVVAD